MKLKFNRFAGPRAFRSLADFARFADAQAKKFATVKSTDQRSYEWWASSLERHWTVAGSAARSDGATPEHVQQTIINQPTFAYESELSRVLQRMAEAGQHAGAKEIMPFLTGQRDNYAASQLHVPQLSAHAEFHTALALDRHARNGKLGSFEDTVAHHEARLSDMLEADQSELKAARGEFASLLKGAREQHDALHLKAKELIAKSLSEWRETHQSYVDQLATETAVELWSTRATKHEARYKSFRKWTIGFGLVGLLLAFVWIFGGFAIARLVFAGDPTAQVASYTAGSLALFTIFVWGLRVLVRSMLSEDHLSTGASARSALAHTYLALTKEQAATPEDRAIILASLFAPVSDGLVKDDGMPALSPTALAAQMLTNPRP